MGAIQKLLYDNNILRQESKIMQKIKYIIN